MMHYILRDQEVVEEPRLLVWADWFESANRVVEQTQVAPGVEVSTVFLGIDHRFGEGPPLLFETMVFGGECDQEQWRYSTYDQAVEGHREVVTQFSEVLLPETTLEQEVIE